MSTRERAWRVGVMLALTCLLLPTAQADQVRFKNGDRLTGKIKRVQDGKIEFISDLAGTLSIPLENVETFETDGPVALYLSDGSVLKQRVATSEPGYFKVMPEGVLGEQTLPMEKVNEVNPRPVQWDGSLVVSADIDAGNTVERDYAVRFEAVRRGKVDRITGRLTYEGERTKSSGRWRTTKREVNSTMQYDYFLSDRTFGWGASLFEKDGPADLDLRLVVGLGAGIQWIEEADLKFSTLAGPGWISENFSDQTEDDSYLAMRFAYEHEQKVFQRFDVFSRVNWFPSMENGKNHLVHALAGIRTDLLENLFGEARVDYEWDSTPARAADRQDVTYTLGVGWSF